MAQILLLSGYTNYRKTIPKTITSKKDPSLTVKVKKHKLMDSRDLEKYDKVHFVQLNGYCSASMKFAKLLVIELNEKSIQFDFLKCLEKMYNFVHWIISMLDCNKYDGAEAVQRLPNLQQIELSYFTIKQKIKDKQCRVFESMHDLRKNSELYDEHLLKLHFKPKPKLQTIDEVMTLINTTFDGFWYMHYQTSLQKKNKKIEYKRLIGKLSLAMNEVLGSIVDVKLIDFGEGEANGFYINETSGKEINPIFKKIEEGLGKLKGKNIAYPCEWFGYFDKLSPNKASFYIFHSTGFMQSEAYRFETQLQKETYEQLKKDLEDKFHDDFERQVRKFIFNEDEELNEEIINDDNL